MSWKDILKEVPYKEGQEVYDYAKPFLFGGKLPIGKQGGFITNRSESVTGRKQIAEKRLKQKFGSVENARKKIGSAEPNEPVGEQPKTKDFQVFLDIIDNYQRDATVERKNKMTPQMSRELNDKRFNQRMAEIPEELRRRTPRRRKPVPYMSSADLRMNE